MEFVLFFTFTHSPLLLLSTIDGYDGGGGEAIPKHLPLKHSHNPSHSCFRDWPLSLVGERGGRSFDPSSRGFGKVRMAANTFTMDPLFPSTGHTKHSYYSPLRLWTS